MYESINHSFKIFDVRVPRVVDSVHRLPTCHPCHSVPLLCPTAGQLGNLIGTVLTMVSAALMDAPTLVLDLLQLLHLLLLPQLHNLLRRNSLKHQHQLLLLTMDCCFHLQMWDTIMLLMTVSHNNQVHQVHQSHNQVHQLLLHLDQGQLQHPRLLQLVLLEPTKIFQDDQNHQGQIPCQILKPNR